MNKKRYLRIIHQSQNDDLESVQYLALELVQAFPALTIDAPISPHPRGGFILYCAFDDAEIEAVARFLSNCGWQICIWASGGNLLKRKPMSGRDAAQKVG